MKIILQDEDLIGIRAGNGDKVAISMVNKINKIDIIRFYAYYYYTVNIYKI
jgi:hypothetical protein